MKNSGESLICQEILNTVNLGNHNLTSSYDFMQIYSSIHTKKFKQSGPLKDYTFFISERIKQKGFPSTYGFPSLSKSHGENSPLLTVIQEKG